MILEKKCNNETSKVQVLIWSQIHNNKERIRQQKMKNKSKIQWTTEEDQMLKNLRENEKKEKWSQIAIQINAQSDRLRTPKQCRERYISTARFFGLQQESIIWTQEEQKLIFDLYLEHGPKWTLFVESFQLRSQNSIKNRFYNFIRKTLRRMNEANEARYPHSKKALKMESILVILELSKKIENQGESLIGYKLNISQLDLLQIRNEIFKVTVAAEKAMQGQLLELVDRIHHANCYLRHLGIFKAKNKKSWRLDKKRFQYIIGMQGDGQKETASEIISGQKMELDLLEIVEELSAKEDIFFDGLMQESSTDAHKSSQNWAESFNKQMWEILDGNEAQIFSFDYSL